MGKQYNTRKWNESVQWPEGDRIFEKKTHYLGGDYILEQTIDPEPGKATKEIFFTSKNMDVYAITPTYPKGKLTIKSLKPGNNTKVSLLGYDGELNYVYTNGSLVVDVLPLTYDELPCIHAWSFKITNVN